MNLETKLMMTVVIIIAMFTFEAVYSGYRDDEYRMKCLKSKWHLESFQRWSYFYCNLNCK